MIDQQYCIEVRDLSKRFGTVSAVTELSFTVEPGVVTGFLGPNGSGKSTTLRMILGLVAPTSGTATINGQRHVDLPEPGRVVGAVFDAANLHPRRSARNHLRVHAALAGLPKRRVDEVIEQLGITDFADRLAGGFSTGMRQRLNLATALLSDPPVLLLDEPTNGLDPQGMAWLRQVLRDCAAAGRTVLVSSHVLSEMEQIVDDVVVIKAGRLIGSGNMQRLAQRIGTSLVVRSPEVTRLAESLRTSTDIGVHEIANDSLRVTGISAEEVAQIAAAQAIPIYQLTPEQSNLEQLFLGMTNDTQGAI